MTVKLMEPSIDPAATAWASWTCDTYKPAADVFHPDYPTK